MDPAVCLLLALEALFGLWLLWRAELLDSPYRVALSLALMAAAFLLRAGCLSYETLDYRDFLSHWVAFYRENLGFRSLSYPLGNYNIPYLYFLCFFSAACAPLFCLPSTITIPPFPVFLFPCQARPSKCPRPPCPRPP